MGNTSSMIDCGSTNYTTSYQRGNQSQLITRSPPTFYNRSFLDLFPVNFSSVRKLRCIIKVDVAECRAARIYCGFICLSLSFSTLLLIPWSPNIANVSRRATFLTSSPCWCLRCPSRSCNMWIHDLQQGFASDVYCMHVCQTWSGCTGGCRKLCTCNPLGPTRTRSEWDSNLGHQHGRQAH